MEETPKIRAWRTAFRVLILALLAAIGGLCGAAVRLGGVYERAKVPMPGLTMMLMSLAALLRSAPGFLALAASAVIPIALARKGTLDRRIRPLTFIAGSAVFLLVALGGLTLYLPLLALDHGVGAR